MQPTILLLRKHLLRDLIFFNKNICGDLIEVKKFAGNGLFTSDTDGMDWQLAHKLLASAFNSRTIKVNGHTRITQQKSKSIKEHPIIIQYIVYVYQVEMELIVQREIIPFEPFSPDKDTDITRWIVNLTFETIGKIGFEYDFHLIDNKDIPQHPFINAMVYCLKLVFIRFKQPNFMKSLPIEQNLKFDEAVKLGLSDENIRDQIVTFSIADHETTFAILAFTIYELQEITNAGITHDKLPTSEQIRQLKYTRMILKESLSLHAHVGALSRRCIKDYVLLGSFFMKKGSKVICNVRLLHCNENVYPNPFKLDPDHWTLEEEQKRSRFT